MASPALPVRRARPALPADPAAASSARLPRRICRSYTAGSGNRRRDPRCSARAGRIPARATARWHRFFAPKRLACAAARPRLSASAAISRKPRTPGGWVWFGGCVPASGRRGCPAGSRAGGSVGSCMPTEGCGGRGGDDDGGGGLKSDDGSRLLRPEIALLRRRRRARRASRPSRRRIARLGGVGAWGAGAECIAGAGMILRARPRGRAGPPRIRPCAPPLPATAAGG